jgi:PKD repeat protein
VAARNNPPTAVLTADCTDLDCTFDGSGSTDPDGGITAYAWDFGDGRSGATQQGTHTYAEPGVYSVVLTVTDTTGATGSASLVVTAVAPNRPPVAGFGVQCTDLDCAFDATRASDPDGSVTGYAWDFGDGTTGTGVSPSHTYTAGTYTATLTVTDDDGATDRISHEVTAVEPNRPPVAAFTSQVTDLSVVFNASGSHDSDGTIASYAWDFGDGSSATGVTASHKYKAAGEYRVTVTVTDDDGATGTTSANVTATDPILAADTFTRTVAGGWGTAETGGAWTTTGSGGVFSVVDGSARLSVPSSRTIVARLGSVSSLNIDLVHTVWLEQAATSSGSYLYSTARSTSPGDYRAKIKIVPTGVATIQIVKSIGSADTALGTAIVAPDVQYVPGQKLRVRIQAFGASPTTIRAKVWPLTGTEPTAWLTSVTDSTTGMQIPGAVGVASYLAGSFSAAVARWDDVVATERTELVTNP